MPLPFKPGYNFNYDRTIRKPHYEMPDAEAYTDFYGISYMIKGERLIDSMVAELFDTIGIESYQELCAEHVIRFEKSTQEKIMTIMNDMEQEWNCYNKYSELVLKGLLNKLIILCLRERIIGGVNVGSLEKRHDCLANAIKYIKMHLHDNLTLEAVARQVNISASCLSKIFINYLHTPFSAFVLNEKITYAQKLLSDSNLSITEIAVEAGFSSSSYFSDCFKRSTGMSPMQFRKRNT